jgi:predicted AlkP superfamily pyrophosphatase or phosphodiesterase
MENKVLLILVDGMRPDAMKKCGHPYIEKLLNKSSYTLFGRTVMPSVTLPCHMSLFHSVTPQRHGVLTNTYTPQVRPIEGLFEQVHRYEGKTAMIYDWEELRDVSRPGVLDFSLMVCGHAEAGMHRSMKIMTEEIRKQIQDEKPDFTFYYIGLPDESGHKYGWMSKEYIEAVSEAWDSIEKVSESLPSQYSLIVTADHGGHDRCHGTESPEDMTIPILCSGNRFQMGDELEEASILDIAPTVVDILNIPGVKEWEGKSLIQQ